METRTKVKKRRRVPKGIFIICIVSIFTYVLYQRGRIPVIAILSKDEDASLEYVRDIIEVEISGNQDFIVNEDQLIWVTEDGVKALSLEGEEIWADTHTLKNISVAQRTPYFAVSDSGGNNVSIFDTYGKKSDIKFANPLMYVSMNNQGDVVVVESTGDGHIISAYDEKGDSLGVKRVTYIQDVGYPIVAEISPDGKAVIISYLDTSDAQITSNIIAMQIRSDEITEIDNILYGETYKNTIISEIEFVDENTWVAIGDNIMSFNKLDGREIQRKDNIYYNNAPVLDRLKDWQGINYPVISSEQPIKSTVHPVEKLVFYSQVGEEVEEITLDGGVTSMYSDGKITITGSERKFTAYNRVGKKRWEYTATKDVQKIIPLSSQHQVVMISKGKAELMQVVK